MPFPVGTSGVTLTVDNTVLTGSVTVEPSAQAPSSLVVVVSTPHPNGYSMSDAQVRDAFTALHALTAGT